MIFSLKNIAFRKRNAEFCSSKTSASLCRLHGVTFQEVAIFSASSVTCGIQSFIFVKLLNQAGVGMAQSV